MRNKFNEWFSRADSEPGETKVTDKIPYEKDNDFIKIDTVNEGSYTATSDSQETLAAHADAEGYKLTKSDSPYFVDEETQRKEFEEDLRNPEYTTEEEYRQGVKKVSPKDFKNNDAGLN